MKACVLHDAKPIDESPLALEEVDPPAPKPGEVLIEVAACGVCRTDLHIVEGDLRMRKQPVIPGHQIVGRIRAVSGDTEGLVEGDRVGVAWLRSTCNRCAFCISGRTNLCDDARFTGWTDDGGFAQYVAAPAQFVYRLPTRFDDLAAAPLLCAGIIGYRCLRQCEINDWSNARLGLYGFGAAAHIAIQIAVYRGAEVHVFTRDRAKHYRLAQELGAASVNQPQEPAPVKLDASIVFAPAGEIVPVALQSLDKAGRLVLGGIHMSPIPSLDYRDLYGERVIRTITNNTREDGDAFLQEAADADVSTHVVTYPLNQANDALYELKHGAVRGAAVLTM